MTRQNRKSFQRTGAENETRTRDPDLGKVVLYQLSYFRGFFFRKATAKVQTFSETESFFYFFFTIFFISLSFISASIGVSVSISISSNLSRISSNAGSSNCIKLSW